jgi:hypothetical protein
MMADKHKYYDLDGKPVSLYWLVRNEPEWAQSWLERYRDDAERLQAILDEQESIVLGAGSIVCRNGKTHDITGDGCLYCENERLQAELEMARLRAREAEGDLMDLEAENAKLRESLETIADSLSCTGEDAGWMIEEARQALAAQEKG